MLMHNLLRTNKKHTVVQTIIESFTHIALKKMIVTYIPQKVS
jgi:flagellar biosynthesis GTPase FlhF